MDFTILKSDFDLKNKHDSEGVLSFDAPHALWPNNIAAASQLWPLEFVACKTRIHIIDTSQQGPGKIVAHYDFVPVPSSVHQSDPWWSHAPRGVTYLTIKQLCRREVLIAGTDEGAVNVWYTRDLLQGNLNPVAQFECDDSVWALDVHASEPLIATGDNSQRITVFGFWDGTVRRLGCSEELGGNIPSLCFCRDFIAFTTLTLDMLGGTFGVMNAQLDIVYVEKIQQSGWCIKLVANLQKVNSPFGLCGTQDDVHKPAEFQLTECVDSCKVAYEVELCDRLGFNSRWIRPQTWILDQQKQLKEWAKHGRRKQVAMFDRVPELRGLDLFLTTSVHASLVAADSGICLATGHKAFMPPGVLPSEEFAHLALSIVEIIEPLCLAVIVSRAAVVTIVRFTKLGSSHSFRQESVLCDFSDFIVGLSIAPARAHDLRFDLEQEEQPSADYDVPDPSIGLTGKYLMRLHLRDGKCETFILE